MKLGQINIFNSALKNQATTNAALNTFKQAKTECRELSKLTMTVANLAAEINQEITELMNLPGEKNPSVNNPFTRLAQDHVDQLKSISSDFKKLSDETRAVKRQIAKIACADKVAKAYSVGVGAAAIGAAVPTFGTSLLGLVTPLVAAKVSKNSFLENGDYIVRKISKTFESEQFKSIDSQISQMKDMASAYNISTEKIQVMLNEIVDTQARLNNPEISPFTHKAKEVTQKFKELRSELANNRSLANSYEINRSTIDFALDEVKQSENYKAVFLKGSRTNSPEHLKSDMDHFFSKIEKRKFKTYIQHVESNKTSPHFVRGLNSDSLI